MRELPFLLSLPQGWSAPLGFSSSRSCKLCVVKLYAAQARELYKALELDWAGNVVREVGREIFEVEKRAEKSLGRGRGWVFGLSPKQLEQPHPQLVHWWLLVSLQSLHYWFQTPISLGVALLNIISIPFLRLNQVSPYRIWDFSS